MASQMRHKLALSMKFYVLRAVEGEKSFCKLRSWSEKKQNFPTLKLFNEMLHRGLDCDMLQGEENCFIAPFCPIRIFQLFLFLSALHNKFFFSPFSPFGMDEIFTALFSLSAYFLYEIDRHTIGDGTNLMERQLHNENRKHKLSKSIRTFSTFGLKNFSLPQLSRENEK